MVRLPSAGLPAAASKPLVASCGRTSAAAWCCSSSIQAATAVRACSLAGKCRTRRNSNSKVECHDSMTALSRADPGRPIDWAMQNRWQAALERPGGVFAALVAMHNHAGRLPPAHGDGHGQRSVGRGGVVLR